MRTDAAVVIGSSTLIICAVGITAAFLIKRNQGLNVNEAVLQAQEKVSLLDKIVEVIKSMAWEVIEKLVKYIRDYILELVFKTKTVKQDQKVNWSV